MLNGIINGNFIQLKRNKKKEILICQNKEKNKTYKIIHLIVILWHNNKNGISVIQIKVFITIDLIYPIIIFIQCCHYCVMNNSIFLKLYSYIYYVIFFYLLLLEMNTLEMYILKMDIMEMNIIKNNILKDNILKMNFL